MCLLGRRIIRELRRIVEELESLKHPVNSFKIISSNIRRWRNEMNINPGQSTILTAVPLDASGVQTTLPVGDIPNWSVSDASKITATPSADGLSLSVTVNNDGSATPGDIVFTITDAQIPSAVGTFTLTIPQPTANPVASFAVSASTPTS